MKALHRFPDRDVRNEAGFSLLELGIVLAIVGVLVALTVPRMVGYARKDDARHRANTLAGVLSTARAQAKSFGQPVVVMFNQPGLTESEADDIALMVRDLDSNYTIDSSDQFTNYKPAPGRNTEVTGWGLGTARPFETAALPPEDPVGTGQLTGLTGASTFPIDPTTAVPAVAFNPQGVPVALTGTTTPGAPGSGAGAYYVTDNSSTVYAVILQPLGGLRVRQLNPETGTWQ